MRSRRCRANPNIIEAKNGFYDTLVGTGHYDAERMAEGLGNPFYIESPGIGLKNIQAAITPIDRWTECSSCWERTG
jgi:hypothetical protein